MLTDPSAAKKFDLRYLVQLVQQRNQRPPPDLKTVVSPQREPVRITAGKGQ